MLWFSLIEQSNSSVFIKSLMGRGCKFVVKWHLEAEEVVLFNINMHIYSTTEASTVSFTTCTVEPMLFVSVIVVTAEACGFIVFLFSLFIPFISYLSALPSQIIFLFDIIKVGQIYKEIGSEFILQPAMVWLALMWR